MAPLKSWLMKRRIMDRRIRFVSNNVKQRGNTLNFIELGQVLTVVMGRQASGMRQPDGAGLARP
jgi:hypothetical protein